MILLSMKSAGESAVASSVASPPPPPPPSSSSLLPPWFPSTTVCRQLFLTGSTIGPMIDGLHNQCLLQYKVAPIIIDVPHWLSSISSISSSSSSSDVATLTTNSYFEPHLFASSWCVPPLLGIAYIVLGGILPRILQNIITIVRDKVSTTKSDITMKRKPIEKPPSSLILGFKAILAVLSTAMIILFSQYLILHPNESNYGIIDNTAVFESSDKLEQHLLILMTAAITQWAYLDGTLVAFLTASVTSVFGPLSELPFIAHHIWEYLPDAGDIYLPLQSIESTSIPGQFLQGTLGDEYASLALNGVTGPCYFAVTMDAIAIGRFFTSIDTSTATRSGSSNRNRNENIDIIPENRLFIASSRELQSTASPITGGNDPDTIDESTSRNSSSKSDATMDQGDTMS